MVEDNKSKLGESMLPDLGDGGSPGKTADAGPYSLAESIVLRLPWLWAVFIQHFLSPSTSEACQTDIQAVFGAERENTGFAAPTWDRIPS